MEEIKPILDEVCGELRSLYGERVVKIVLYGSYARGDSRKHSDIDIALVLTGEVNRFKEIKRIVNAIYDIELEHDILISVYATTLDEYENSDWPLYYHIKNEGIILYERDKVPV